MKLSHCILTACAAAVLSMGLSPLHAAMRIEGRLSTRNSAPMGKTAPPRPPAIPPAPTVEADKPLPDQLKEYADLRQDAEKYRDLTTAVGWKTVASDLFKKSDDKPQWKLSEVDVSEKDPTPIDLKDAAGLTSIENVDGHTALVLDVQKYASGFVAVGPKVTAPYSIEFKAALLTDKGGDLSVFADRLSNGIGFQFAAWARTRNQFWTGPQNVGQGKIEQFPMAAPMAKPPETSKFYTVRMVVDGKSITGWVDGQQIASYGLSQLLDKSKPAQLYLYTFGSKAAFSDVTIQEYGRHDIGKPEDSWKKAFGKLSKDDVKQRADELVVYLDDSDPKVRDGAESVLSALGELAKPSLEAIGAGGSPEQTTRVARLLQALQPVQHVELPPTQKIHPPTERMTQKDRG